MEEFSEQGSKKEVEQMMKRLPRGGERDCKKKHELEERMRCSARSEDNRQE